MIVLAVTGMLLNHTGEIGLDTKHVSSPALLDWYGIQAPDNIRAFAAGSLSIAELDGQWYINNARLAYIEGTLTGAVAYRDMVLASSATQLVLLTTTGELLEPLGRPAGIAGDIQAVGTDNAGLPVLRTRQGDFRSDADLLQWSRAPLADVRWAMPATLDEADRASLAQAWRGNGLPLERVVLDLHSGRILGPWGVYLMDAAAILFLVLAVSGVWLWSRRRASARAHQRKITQRGPHETD